MRNLNRLSILSSTGALLVMGTLGVEATRAQRAVTVTVHRVAQIDNLDKDLPFLEDRADFYAEIWIDGRYHRTPNMSKNDGRPYWRFTSSTYDRNVLIRMKLIDDDGGLERKDDYVDINRRSLDKDLVFTFDTWKGRITGDVSGSAGSMIHSFGAGDSTKGEIWFTVNLGAMIGPHAHKRHLGEWRPRAPGLSAYFGQVSWLLRMSS